MTEIEDIAYASQSAAQKLDIYLPDGSNGPFPVVIWLHPGGFTAGDKKMGQGFSVPLSARGYATVSANYRLADEALFPAQIFDAKAAVRWVRSSAAQYNFDKNRIAAWGISAGATLAALLGTTTDIKELEDLSMGNPSESSAVSAVIDWLGPVDFLQLGAQRKQAGQQYPPGGGKSGESMMFGGTAAEVPDKYKAASALYHVTAKCPPFYIHHGTADDVVPCAQSVELASALEAAIGKENVTLHLIEGANHFDKIHATEENVMASIGFLDKYLKR